MLKPKTYRAYFVQHAEYGLASIKKHLENTSFCFLFRGFHGEMSLSGDSQVDIGSGGSESDAQHTLIGTQLEESQVEPDAPGIPQPQHVSQPLPSQIQESDREDNLRQAQNYILKHEDIQLKYLRPAQVSEGQTRTLFEHRILTHLESVRQNPPSQPVPIPVIDNKGVCVSFCMC